jgi:hypothetical protein
MNYFFKGQAAAAAREKLLDLSLKELTNILIEKRLPLPMGWYKIKDCIGSIYNNCSNLNFFHTDPDNDVFNIEEKNKDKQKKLGDILQVKDKLRLTNSENEQNDCEVLSVINKEDMQYSQVTSMGFVNLTQNWPNNSQREVDVFKYCISKRKSPYISKLISKEFHDEVAPVNAAGFSAIYKLMAGQTVECPLCLDIGFYIFHYFI